MISFQIDPLTIEIVDGNIADQEVDAVVNAANNHFWMGAGVAGALKTRGGTDIEREAMALGPVSPGECVVTGGGQLPAPHVIHAAVMGQNLATTGALIFCSTTRTLEIAEAHGFKSIALPAFGTGVGGFQIDECARIMLTAVRKHAPEAHALELVRFVLFGHWAYDAFAAAAREMFKT